MTSTALLKPAVTTCRTFRLKISKRIEYYSRVISPKNIFITDVFVSPVNYPDDKKFSEKLVDVARGIFIAQCKAGLIFMNFSTQLEYDLLEGTLLNLKWINLGIPQSLKLFWSRLAVTS
jgi:hypothetical protein